MRHMTIWAGGLAAASLSALLPLLDPGATRPLGALRAAAAVPVPEPSTLVLLGVGLIGLAALGVIRRRRKRPSGVPRAGGS